VPSITPQALQQDIHRTQVGDHPVGVGVEAFLEHLGGHDDAALAAGRIAGPAQGRQHILLDAPAVHGGESGMEQGAGADPEALHQARPCPAGIANGITHPDHGLSGCMPSCDALQHLTLIGQVLNIQNPPAVWRGRERQLLYLAAERRRPTGQQRIVRGLCLRCLHWRRAAAPARLPFIGLPATNPRGIGGQQA